jgi:hypothetical protein
MNGSFELDNPVMKDVTQLGAGKLVQNLNDRIEGRLVILNGLAN